MSSRNARYKLKVWKYWRSHGLCGRCGMPTGVNKVKGKNYAECFRHRLKTARRANNYQRRKRGRISRASD